MDNIAPIRERIDVIDRQLVDLINQRLAHAAEIGKIKRDTGASIYDAEREAEVYRKVTAASKGPAKNDALKSIYREIMSAAIDLEKPRRIAYLGPEATNSHLAALKQFGSSAGYLPLQDFAAIFNAVENGDADCGIIPAANGIAPVREAIDCFLTSDAKIIGQFDMEITHCLISKTPINAIKKVYSKKPVLDLLYQWLSREIPGAEHCEAATTADAVKIAATEPGAAAIANEFAAQLHNVPILVKNIHAGGRHGMTRFSVISKKPAPRAGGAPMTTSLLIYLAPNAGTQAGSLLKILGPFSDKKINLSRIDTFFTGKVAGDYYFYIDADGHHDDPAMREALAAMRPYCTLLKWLGSYPRI